MPNVARVFGHGAVGRKQPRARDVHEAHAVPSQPVAVGRVHAILRLAVGAQVRKEHVVVVVVLQRAQDRIEEARIEHGEHVPADHVERQADLGILTAVLARIVGGTQRRHVLGAQAEEEHVVVANLFVDLDVRAVVGAQRQRAVHHELHVARAGRLHAGEGYLFRHLGGGHYLLGERDAVVGKERDGDLAARLRVSPRSRCRG